MFKSGDRVSSLIDFSSARRVAGNYYRNPKRGNLGVVLDDFQSSNGFRMVTLNWVRSGTKLDNLHVHDWPFPNGDAERALELFVVLPEFSRESVKNDIVSILQRQCRFPDQPFIDAGIPLPKWQLWQHEQERGERLLPFEQRLADGSFCEISSAACRYPVARGKRAKDGDDGDL